MTTGWELSRKMMPTIIEWLKSVPLGCVADITAASIERDLTEATDQIIRMHGADFGIRVRQYRHHYSYLGSYGDNEPLGFDWSIRFRAKYGGRTEIDKLREGFCNYYVMAIANQSETGLIEIALIDLSRVRAAHILERHWEVYPNLDGTYGGYYPMRQLNKLGCIIWPKIEIY